MPSPSPATEEVFHVPRHASCFWMAHFNRCMMEPPLSSLLSTFRHRHHSVLHGVRDAWMEVSAHNSFGMSCHPSAENYP